MNEIEIIPGLEPGTLTTIHSEGAFGKENSEIELCKEIYQKYESKPLLFRLNHKLRMVEDNISDIAYIVDQQYDHDVDSICRKAEGLILSYPVKVVIVDCLEELTIQGDLGDRDSQVEFIKDDLIELAIRRKVSVVLMTEHQGKDTFPELDLEKGSLLEQLNK